MIEFPNKNPISAPAPNTCGELGLGFAPTVAHGIHSLTVEDIRHYFKADAPVENNIPTVNKDLTGARVLSYAPLAGYDTHFETSAMQILDVVGEYNNTNIPQYYK